MRLPGHGAWTFESEDVASHFDEHVREQLPWYSIATSAVANIAEHYIGTGGLVYDIGASTGNVGNALRDALERRSASLVAIEPSQKMADFYRGPGTIIRCGAEQVDFQPFDVAIAFLSLLFMRVDDRARVLDRLRKAAQPGGCIIVVDKMRSSGSYLATALWRLAMLNKLAAGASLEDILRKELSLIGVQRPLSEEELGLGAREFFRLGEFAGYVIET